MGSVERATGGSRGAFEREGVIGRGGSAGIGSGI